MALKADRVVLETTMNYTCPTVAAAGFGLVVLTAGSGVALGDSAGVADLVADPSGKKFAGILMNDVESVDETRYHRNFHKDVQLTGERVTLLRKGRVTTNALVSGQSPTDGQTAYLSTDGKFTPTKSTTGGLVATPPVGEFKGLKDESGYVCIDINLPFPVM